MTLFCFASRSLENIWRGVRAERWAVSTASDACMKGRVTKAKRYFKPGVRGLLYCNETHTFTVPFVATSFADPKNVEANVWQTAWALPFSMRPLGDPRRQVAQDDAWSRWPLLIRRKTNNPNLTSVSAALNFTGTTVFAPVDIIDEDWDIILRDLAIEP